MCKPVRKGVDNIKNRNKNESATTCPPRGVFWLIDGEIMSVVYDGNHQEGVAKSGETYNHRLLWEHVKPKGCNVPFDYYPRGRVDVTNKGKPVIYMNPNIDISHIAKIVADFGLSEQPVVRIDSSEHYKCYLDREQ